jgi:hypothetical protein
MAFHLLSFKEKCRQCGRHSFFYPKFRIAGWEGKPANFVDVEGPVNQWLLLWVSGGKLTRKDSGQRSGLRSGGAAKLFAEC